MESGHHHIYYIVRVHTSMRSCSCFSLDWSKASFLVFSTFTYSSLTPLTSVKHTMAWVLNLIVCVCVCMHVWNKGATLHGDATSLLGLKGQFDMFLSHYGFYCWVSIYIYSYSAHYISQDLQEEQISSHNYHVISITNLGLWCFQRLH